MIRLGIIGAGRLGGFHADKATAHANVELVAVFDPIADSCRALAEKHKIKALDSAESMFGLVDAVVIAVPTVLHHSVGLPFLKRGIHVLMEKPMTATSLEALELLNAARASGSVLQVGHVEQFNPAWTFAEPILEPIRRGEKAIFEATRTSGYTFRSVDIGVVLDLMIHDLDLILSAVSSPVVSVEATGFHYFGAKERGAHEDVAAAQIRFENGSMANIHASRIELQAVRQMRIRTSLGSASIDFATRNVKIVRPKTSIISGNFAPDRVDPTAIGNLAKTIMSEQFEVVEQTGDAVDALGLEMDDFVKAIETKRPPQVPGTRAIKSVEVAQRILDSCLRKN